MAFLLRKISPSKWQPNLTRKPENFTADAITKCTPTTNNTLSVWHSNTNDFEDESVQKLIVGLALTMNRPDKIDVLWLDEDKLRESGLEIEFTEVPNHFKEIIERHKDIVNLDYSSLGMVSEHIVEQFVQTENVHSISRPKLIALVSDWEQRDETFSIEDLNDKWVEAIEKLRQRERAAA